MSYSIYLLHEIIPSAFKRLGLMTTDIAVAWVTWTGSLLLLALISPIIAYRAPSAPWHSGAIGAAARTGAYCSAGQLSTTDLPLASTGR